MCLFIFLGTTQIYSQDRDFYEKYDIYRNPIRVILNKFSITATTGLAFTNYSHKLDGAYFFQDASNQFVISNEFESLGSGFSGFTNWLNDPQMGEQIFLKNPFAIPFNNLPNLVNNPTLLEHQTFLINTDTVDFGFSGTSKGVPFTLMIHYEYKNFRVGAGYTYEVQTLRRLNPTAFPDKVRAYQPNVTKTRYSRLFGMVGYRVHQFWSYDFVAELQFGKISAGKGFNNEVISRGLYTNLGISIENNWSEYFRLIIRPSIDFKTYTIELPDGAVVKHKYPTFFIQVGISINIPDIPRSPMKSDHAQLKHVYTDPVTRRRMEVRGQPIHKRQNPKIGENHRRLWRNKLKNRRKFNPTKD